jgi:hypothetical protein
MIKIITAMLLIRVFEVFKASGVDVEQKLFDQRWLAFAPVGRQKKRFIKSIKMMCYGNSEREKEEGWKTC